MCLNEINSKSCIDNHLSHVFAIQNGPQQGDALLPLFFNVALGYSVRKVQKSQEQSEFNEHISFWCMLVMLIWWVKEKNRSSTRC
jgi:hypothetical protein